MAVRTITAAKPSALLVGNSTSAQIFTDAVNAAIAAILNVPGSKRLEQKRFNVRASGYLTSAGSATTALPTLYFGTSLTPGSNTILGAGTATTVNTTSCPWWMEATLLFDSISGKLQGSFSSMVNNVIVANAAIANVPTGINGASEPVISLVCGMTFSAASAANFAGMSEFVLED